MSIENGIVILFTILFSIGSIIMLRYEWIKVEGAEKQGFWKFPLWLRIYGVIMLVVQVGLAYLLLKIYKENTPCMFIKRLGLLALIWQAAAIDWKYHKIPNDIILAGAAFRVIMLIPEFLIEREMIISNLISEGIALVGIIILVIICLIFMRNSIGMGDLKLLMIMAACQGLNGVMTSGFMSMLVSFVVAVTLLIMRKKTRKDVIPFAPCILIGTLLGVFLTGI